MTGNYSNAYIVSPLFSVSLTKDMAGKTVSKAVPIVGGLISGGLTIATFPPMAKKLRKELSQFAAMSPENLEKATLEADAVLADFEVVSEDVSVEES